MATQFPAPHVPSRRPPATPSEWRQTRKYSGLAIAAMVCGICGFLYLIPAIVGVVFGHVAYGQIKKSNGLLAGKGMATAGFVCGYAWIGVMLLVALGNIGSGSGY